MLINVYQAHRYLLSGRIPASLQKRVQQIAGLPPNLLRLVVILCKNDHPAIRVSETSALKRVYCLQFVVHAACLAASMPGTFLHQLFNSPRLTLMRRYIRNAEKESVLTYFLQIFPVNAR